MKNLFLILFLLSASHGYSQWILECDRYYISDLKDTLLGQGQGQSPAVFFKMHTDTNTANSGYTDLYFVDQFADTLNMDSTWSYWMPSTANVPNDTVEYVLYFEPGFTTFPTDFNGHLVAKNPDCMIPFNYALMNTDDIVQMNLQLDIFPNPSRQLFQINNRSNYSIKSIELFDLSGQLRLIKTQNLNSLDLTSFERGAYIVKLRTTDGHLETRRIIKN